MGDQKNCIVAHENEKRPIITEARATLPPSNCSTRSGSTGAMMPSAIRSSATVMRMKMTAPRDASPPGEDTEPPCTAALLLGAGSDDSDKAGSSELSIVSYRAGLSRSGMRLLGPILDGAVFITSSSAERRRDLITRRRTGKMRGIGDHQPASRMRSRMSAL